MMSWEPMRVRLAVSIRKPHSRVWQAIPVLAPPARRGCSELTSLMEMPLLPLKAGGSTAVHVMPGTHRIGQAVGQLSRAAGDDCQKRQSGGCRAAPPDHHLVAMKAGQAQQLGVVCRRSLATLAQQTLVLVGIAACPPARGW